MKSLVFEIVFSVVSILSILEGIRRDNPMLFGLASGLMLAGFFLARMRLRHESHAEQERTRRRVIREIHMHGGSENEPQYRALLDADDPL